MPSQNPETALVYTRTLATKTLPVVIRLECHPSVPHLGASPQSREQDASHSSFFFMCVCACCVSKCPSVWRPVMNITFRRSRGGNSDDEGALHNCILRSSKAAFSLRAHAPHFAAHTVPTAKANKPQSVIRHRHRSAVRRIRNDFRVESRDSGWPKTAPRRTHSGGRRSPRVAQGHRVATPTPPGTWLPAVRPAAKDSRFCS